MAALRATALECRPERPKTWARRAERANTADMVLDKDKVCGLEIPSEIVIRPLRHSPRYQVMEYAWDPQSQLSIAEELGAAAKVIRRVLCSIKQCGYAQVP